jgi:Family of unknown function (DUF5709)
MTNDTDRAPDDAAGDYDELEDDGVLDSSDTLEGEPGDDPLDQGIITPDQWSAGQRYGTTDAEERAGESLDQLLAQEEPEQDGEYGDELPADAGADPDLADEDVDGLLLDDGADPRAGRLVAEDEGAHSDEQPDLVARDVGIDAGAASAEEAAVHVVGDDDRDIRSDDENDL